LARRIGELVPANWTVRSKGQRGYDFIAGATAVVQPRKIQLQRGMNADEAFRVIARSILRDLAANRPAVSDLAPEGVHRMRIDLRRLRAALSVFSELLGDNQTRRLNAELQWLAGKLGAARDLDVMAATIERLRRGKSDRAELRDFAGELAMQRASAFEDARLAVQSRRYRTLLLDALQWIEAGTWATHARSDIGHCRIKTLAENILTRRAKKVIGMAGEFEQLDAGQRHKLRIAVKKLRYSADFFESLFPGGKAKLRYAAFIDDLKQLQDSLGALNDIVVHGALVSKISSGDPRATPRTRDVASGILSERERRISGGLLKAAGKAAAELADAKPFW
jgi:CHAD domain-containing protein